MKRLTLTICAITLLLYSCNNAAKNETTTDSTGKKTETTAKDEEWVPVDSATMMKAMMDYGTPGEPHKMLAKADGNWNAEITMWMAPDAPPSKSMGTSTNKMVMGGRYQESTFKGDMMGMPFNGTSITAYDNAKKEYVSTWYDNMSTGIMVMEGPWDEASKTITMTGEMMNPANNRMCQMKQTLKFVDDNTQLLEMWGPDMKTGKQYKSMEIKFTRK